MSPTKLTDLTGGLREAAVQTAWAQWEALGAMVAVRRPARAIVDPEALVLVSLALREHERRLTDFLVGLAEQGPTLLSVQRVKNLLPAYPEVVHQGLAGFAARAVNVGKDFRWRSLAGREMLAGARPGKVRDSRIGVNDPPALMLRLRLTLGVGVKADVLSFLLGTGERWVSVREAAAATGYRERPVRAALDDLTQARAVQVSTDTPLRYLAPAQSWAALFGLEQIPAWRYWHDLYAFITAVLGWLTEEGHEASSAYLVSSDARRLLERHATAFERNRIVIPRPSDFAGEAYLTAFERTVQLLTTWLGEAV